MVSVRVSIAMVLFLALVLELMVLVMVSWSWYSWSCRHVYTSYENESKTEKVQTWQNIKCEIKFIADTDSALVTDWFDIFPLQWMNTYIYIVPIRLSLQRHTALYTAFWYLFQYTATWALLLDPTGGLLSPRLSYFTPPLTWNPEYVPTLVRMVSLLYTYRQFIVMATTYHTAPGLHGCTTKSDQEIHTSTYLQWRNYWPRRPRNAGAVSYTHLTLPTNREV